MPRIDTEDIINVETITDRIETLELLRQPGPVDLGNDEDNDTPQDELFAELAELEALMRDLVGTGGDEQWRGDWYPGFLIRDSYFEDYARELADDIGAIDANASWPNTYIDWEAAARALQQDYTSVEYDGVTYWVR